MKQYKNATITWAQEEPKNAGGWTYAQPRILNILDFLKKDATVDYAGRPIMAATATGYGKFHTEQLQNLLEHAMK